MATRKKKAAPKKRKPAAKKKPATKKKPVVKRPKKVGAKKKTVVKKLKKKAPRTPALSPREREVDVERTQQLSFSEIIGDIEERQALDRIGELK